MEFVDALINQGWSKEDAENAKQEAFEEIMNFGNPEEVLEQYGLEPDYLLSILM
jgi:hypothetical protein